MNEFVTAKLLKYFSVLALGVLVVSCSTHKKTYHSSAYTSAKQTQTIRSSAVPKVATHTANNVKAPIIVPSNSSPKPSSSTSYPNEQRRYPSVQQYYSYNLTGPYANYFEVKEFIRYMSQKHGFSENYLNGLFSRANRLDSVIRLESPPPSHAPSRPGSWTRYRNKFLTDAHINNGVDFWQNNISTIQRASQEYGVDPEYIVAIIGVETYFGRNIGKTRTFDSLTTLAFDTHRRSKFFTSELEHFLLMAREEGYDPMEPVGSWAGAMGLGQFMPSSFRRLAVDFNHDGRRDLWHEHDAIGSVAHYFSKSGWQYKAPVANPSSKSSAPSVISLSTYQGDEYWQIHPNFKVIKKYNNSNKYAMAVHQLSQAIKHRLYHSNHMVSSENP